MISLVSQLNKLKDTEDELQKFDHQNQHSATLQDHQYIIGDSFDS